MLETVWKLGYVTRHQLRALHAPGTDLGTVTRRLRILREHGLLTRVPVHAGGGDTMAPLTLGPRAGAVAPVYRQPWRPSPWQMAHTLATGDVLLALLSRPELLRGRLVSWHGEAELRGWTQGAAPIPDLLLRVRPDANADREVGVHVEVDLATEARAHWRKKLLRYLYLPDIDVLIVTTSPQRASNLGQLALSEGVRARATTFDALAVELRNPGRPRRSTPGSAGGTSEAFATT
jgi:Replication-relaxation